MKFRFVAFSLVLSVSSAFAQDAKTNFKFSFASEQSVAGYTQVKPDAMYSKELGYGFEPNAPGTATAIQSVDAGGKDALHSGFVTGNGLFKFSVAVPEGNYKVTVTLGDPKGESATTVKAEARRLMLERIHTDAGQFVTRSFMVSVRNPVLPDGRKIKLDVQEVNPQGELITPTWDDKLTLQFSDTRPAVCAVEIEKATPAVTVFLMSDSTVTDQRTEPYGTWGQMLPRWFKPDVVVANYAESGETAKAFRNENRWDKILSQVKPGDYVFIQFGANDLNKTGHNGIWPADDHEGDWPNTYVEGKDYKDLLKQYAAEAKEHGAIPVIVSPMTKINRQTGEINSAGLRNYPQDAMDAAKEAGVAAIDLNAMSVDVWQALGPELDVRGTVDGLHSNSYGGYLLSRCIVEGIKQNHLDLAKYLADDAGTFDPKHPRPLPDDFKVPLEPAPMRGFGGRRGRGFGAANTPSTQTTTTPAPTTTPPAPSPSPAERGNSGN